MAGWLLSDAALAGGSEVSIADRFQNIFTVDGIDLSFSSIGLPALVSHAANAHTPGAWVTVFFETQEDMEALMVNISAATSSSGVDSSTILEIGTGAVSSEVLLSSTLIGFSAGAVIKIIPGFIAAGTRVAARLRSAQLNKSVSNAAFRGIVPRSPALGAPVSYGFDTAASKGVPLTAAGATNTKSAWTQITAATSAEHNVIHVAYQMNADSDIAAGNMLLDIGVGAEGAETVIIPNLFNAIANTEALTFRQMSTFGVNIPVGSRLVARYQSSANTVDRPDVALVCA